MMSYLFLALFGAALSNAAIIGGGGLVGGFSPVSLDDEDVKDVLSFVETRLNAMSNDLYASKMSAVTSVERQVVNGLNYRMEFSFARTGCSKMSLITLESCPLSDNVQTCTAKVYQSFSGERSLDDFSCQPTEKTEKRSGAISGPVDEPEVFRDEAVRALSMANSKLDVSSFKVVEVRTQVVAGMLLYMKVQGMSDGVLTLCDMTVWKRPWMQEPEDFKVQANKCRPVQEVKSKRNLGGKTLAGGVSEEKPVDPLVADMFFKTLATTNGAYKISASKDETKLLSMTEQVVAGMKYVIKLQTTQDGKVKNCKVSLLSQPWMEPANRILASDC